VSPIQLVILQIVLPCRDIILGGRFCNLHLHLRRGLDPLLLRPDIDATSVGVYLGRRLQGRQDRSAIRLQHTAHRFWRPETKKTLPRTGCPRFSLTHLGLGRVEKHMPGHTGQQLEYEKNSSPSGKMPTRILLSCLPREENM